MFCVGLVAALAVTFDRTWQGWVQICICIQKCCVFVLEITKVHVFDISSVFANTTTYKYIYCFTNKRHSNASYSLTGSRDKTEMFFTPVVAR